MFHEASFLGYISLERRFSPHTRTAYRSDLTMFIQYVSEQQCLTSVSEVRHLHIRSWIVSMLQQGQSARSVNRRLSCLKSYFKFLKKRGLVDQDPMRKVVAPKTGKRLPVFVQEPHIELLFEQAPFPAGYLGQCHRLILEILYATGIRRSELANLKLADVDQSRTVLRILGKGGKERLAPFAPYLSRLIETFIEARRAEFPDATAPNLLLDRRGLPATPEFIYRVVKKYLSLVSPAEQRSPHVLRHSFATHLSNHGADLNAIKELLGHSSLAATQVYMHNSIEKLRQVYEQAHPKSKEEEE